MVISMKSIFNLNNINGSFGLHFEDFLISFFDAFLTARQLTPHQIIDLELDNIRY